MHRAAIPFKEYPQLESAYQHIINFRNIYENKNITRTKEMFTKWIKDTIELDIKEFNTAANSEQYHLDNILNFFINRNTNANAESFTNLGWY